MGQTLSSAAQWTSAHEGGHGKLEFSSVNEFILKEIAGFVEELAALKNDESTFVFKRPLSWMTGLDDSDFTLNYHKEGPDVVSDAVDGSGWPTLVLRPKGSAMEVSVSAFEQLGFLAEAAGSTKLLEIRHCLEANRDPVATILGDRVTTAGSDDVAVHHLTEEIASLNQSLDSNDIANVTAKKTMLALLLRLKSLDSRLMRESIKLISAEKKLSPEEVEMSVEILKTYCGSSSDDHALKDVTWLQSHLAVDQNSRRAPLWRQLYGDISYIVATPHDGKPIFITASTHGYFVNGGLRKKTMELDFEKKSAFYKDLVTLLSEKSPHFSKNIEDVEFCSFGRALTESDEHDSDESEAKKPKLERKDESDEEDEDENEWMGDVESGKLQEQAGEIVGENEGFLTRFIRRTLSPFIGSKRPGEESGNAEADDDAQVGTACPLSSTVTDAAETLATQGLRLIAEEKYQDAVECYSSAIALDCRNPVYNCDRAAAYSKMGDHQKCLNDCLRALELDPNYSKAYGRKGLAHTALGQHKEAKECFRKALELEPLNDGYRDDLRLAEQSLREKVFREQLTEEKLASVLPPQQKELIREQLYPLIKEIYPDEAESLCRILLELENTHLLQLIRTRELLKAKMEEALQFLQSVGGKGASVISGAPM